MGNCQPSSQELESRKDIKEGNMPSGDFDIHMDMSPAEYGAIKTMAKRRGRNFKEVHSSSDGRLMFATLELGDNARVFIHKLKSHKLARKVAIYNEEYTRTLFHV
jgi:hypothetical protein